jgi:3-hydroxyacyl-CoA dehydrogenase
MGLVRSADRDGVRILTLDNPPVNALSYALCGELLPLLQAADADPGVRAVVLTGANGIFSAGADINDFSNWTPEAVTVRDVIAQVERSSKTSVAAIERNALGGGLELALACDYRVAAAGARVGLPEIKLGLIPGAGGTQRLPRLIGAQPALQMMLKGDAVPVAEALKSGVVDEVVENDVLAAAVARTSGPKRRISARTAELGVPGAQLFAIPWVLAQAHMMVPPEERGGVAAHALVDAVDAALELPFERGLAREARLFDQLVRSSQSAALRHVFFAERELGKIPGLGPAEPRTVASAGVVGAGTMGTGIALAFADAGIPTVVVEANDEQIERAKQTVFGTFSYQVQRGRISQDEAWRKGQSIRFESDLHALADADLVIEAVFENIDVKKPLFAQLDGIVKPDAILASNTSTLDIDAMAAMTGRPDRFLGLHFFAPANIMKLLEIVRGAVTSPQTLRTGIALARALRKIGVVSGNAFGFIGNRMVFDYCREAVWLAEEGVVPERVDAVLKEFGMAMGPFAMMDLSGLDVFALIEQGNPEATRRRTNAMAKLVEQKRFGQKTGAGVFRYEKGKREPIPDPAVTALFAAEAERAGIAPRRVADDEIVARLMYALVNTGAELLRTGIALRAGDIDIAYVYGYGFPPYRGGPMWYADEVGIPAVLAAIEGFREIHGDVWTPSPLLVQLAANGGTLASATEELAHA